MDFALWNRAAVTQLIDQEYGIKLHVHSVGRYLARWGFTPQKPIKNTYEQCPKTVKKWLEEGNYPELKAAIAERAKAESGKRRNSLG